MKAHRLRGGRSGFSLTEVLVAVAIVAVIGGVAAGILLSAFHLWEWTGVRGRRVAAEDDAVSVLSRDWASSVAAYGLTGDARGCAFWTLVPAGAADDQLVSVEYRYAEGALIRGATVYPGGVRAESQYGPLASFAFGYGDGWDEAQPWRDAWESQTNAPPRMRLSGGSVGRWERTLIRRTP